MKAMILAAGRGERMRPLTDHIPKPLLEIANQPLISYPLLALKKIGINEVVINVSYRAEQIQQELGDGSRYGIKIIYSVEPTVLETGGGIYQALPLLGNEPFIVISADVFTDYPLEKLPKKLNGLAHLVLVNNPEYHAKGDFGLDKNQITLDSEKKFTYASFGVLHPNLFASSQPGVFCLIEVLIPAINANQVTGEIYHGEWNNLGTPDDLQNLNKKINAL